MIIIISLNHCYSFCAVMEVPYCQDLDYYGLSSIKSQLFNNVLVSVGKKYICEVREQKFPIKEFEDCLRMTKV